MAFSARASIPNASFGTWRGLPEAGGSGSGMGQADRGTGMLSQGLGTVGSMGGGWEPSILYLIGFVIVEMIVFHVLSRILK